MYYTGLAAAIREFSTTRLDVQMTLNGRTGESDQQRVYITNNDDNIIIIISMRERAREIIS